MKRILYPILAALALFLAACATQTATETQASAVDAATVQRLACQAFVTSGQRYAAKLPSLTHNQVAAADAAVHVAVELCSGPPPASTADFLARMSKATQDFAAAFAPAAPASAASN
jgi:hypothetical protein